MSAKSLFLYVYGRITPDPRPWQAPSENDYYRNMLLLYISRQNEVFGDMREGRRASAIDVAMVVVAPGELLNFGNVYQWNLCISDALENDGNKTLSSNG